MEERETVKNLISTEDLADGGDFIAQFSVELGEYKNRLAATGAETACARAIRDRLKNETGAKVRLEAFRAYPYIGRGMFPVLGLWYAFSMILYFVSFAGGKIGGILLTLLSLAVFLTGSGIITALFLGNKKLKKLLVSKISYNVVSETSPSTADAVSQKTVVITDNHDAVLGSYFQDFGVMRKIAFIFAPITALLFILFCILKMSVGSDTPTKITAFTILPVINGIVGIFVILTHFSPFEKHARQNNGVGTSAAMATYAYFAEHPELLPKDGRIVYASFGAENAAHGGSEAFINAHPELKNAKVLCIGDIQSGKFQVAEYDAIRKLAFSTDVVSAVRSAAFKLGFDCDTVNHNGLKHALNSLHGYPSGSFAKRGVESATILAKDYHGAVSELDRGDVERLFTLTVATVVKLFDDASSVGFEAEKSESAEETIETSFFWDKKQKR